MNKNSKATKAEAIQAMRKNVKTSHNLLNGESMVIVNGKIHTDNGAIYDPDDFWKTHIGSEWETGYYFLPETYLDSLYELATTNYPKTIKYQGKDYPIKLADINIFLAKVGIFRTIPLIKSKNPQDRLLVSYICGQAALLNKKNHVIPVYDKTNQCDTCGSKDGKEMPNSGYCYHCHTDNWKKIEY